MSEAKGMLELLEAFQEIVDTAYEIAKNSTYRIQSPLLFWLHELQEAASFNQLLFRPSRYKDFPDFYVAQFGSTNHFMGYASGYKKKETNKVYSLIYWYIQTRYKHHILLIEISKKEISNITLLLGIGLGRELTIKLNPYVSIAEICEDFPDVKSMTLPLELITDLEKFKLFGD